MSDPPHGPVTSVAFVVGTRPPVIQVVYDPEGDPSGMAWFTIVLSDAPPPGEVGELEPVCAHCLIDDLAGVGVPLDLAVKHGCSVVWSEETGWEPVPDYFDEPGQE